MREWITKTNIGMMQTLSKVQELEKKKSIIDARSLKDVRLDLLERLSLLVQHVQKYDIHVME
jgi:hypothetical protein